MGGPSEEFSLLRGIGDHAGSGAAAARDRGLSSASRSSDVTCEAPAQRLIKLPSRLAT